MRLATQLQNQKWDWSFPVFFKDKPNLLYMVLVNRERATKCSDQNQVFKKIAG